MKKHIEYILVDNNGTVYHHFETKAQAENAVNWFPSEMEVHVEELMVWG